MSRIRLYFDEDAMQHALVVALRARRVDVLTASDCGMVGRSDEEHLRHASNDGRVSDVSPPKHFTPILFQAVWVYSEVSRGGGHG